MQTVRVSQKESFQSGQIHQIIDYLYQYKVLSRIVKKLI